MNKHMLLLACLQAVGGAALAESSMTLSGVVDANVRYVKNGDSAMKLLGTDGVTGSRLAWRGREDLGDGWQAGVTLEAGISPDAGTTGAKFFNRRSHVAIGGPFGELRLGRDDTPSFRGWARYDPFYINGVGGLGNLWGLGPAATLGSNAATLVRADNLVTYLLPEGMPVYGQLTLGAGEGATGGRYEGLRLGYASKPFDVSASASRTLVANDEHYRTSSLGGHLTLGGAKWMAVAVRSTWRARRELVWSLGGVVSVGLGDIRASYARKNASGDKTDANDTSQLALGYVHHLSRRTALYATHSRLLNHGASRLTTSLGSGPAVPPGASSTGDEIGIHHVF